MNYFEIFLFVIEMLSVTSFAISGSITALKKNMDIFGVMVLGLTTSVGGGIIRDIILGINPPKIFFDPSYAIVALITSLVTFLVEYIKRKKNYVLLSTHSHFNELCLFWLDTIGLAIFTMVGISTAYEKSVNYSDYLVCSVGVITGVGGGLTCDILARNTPRLFVKHVYASASIAGSILCVSLWDITGPLAAMILGACLIVLLRFLAMTFKWNFPRVENYNEPLSPKVEMPSEKELQHVGSADASKKE